MRGARCPWVHPHHHIHSWDPSDSCKGCLGASGALCEHVFVLKMIKYRVGVQLMGSQISVRESGYTQESVRRNKVPCSLGFLENPALDTGEAAGGDSSVTSKVLALHEVEPGFLLCSALAHIPACSTPKGVKAPFGLSGLPHQGHSKVTCAARVGSGPIGRSENTRPAACTAQQGRDGPPHALPLGPRCPCLSGTPEV